MEHRAPAAQPGPVPLVLVDTVAIVAFVLVGVRAHHEGSAAGVFVRNAVPLLVCWFGAALVFHPYRSAGITALLRTWVVSTPVALLVRTALVGSPTGVRLMVFLAVAMAFTLLFLLIGRGIATLVATVTGARTR